MQPMLSVARGNASPVIFSFAAFGMQKDRLLCRTTLKTAESHKRPHQPPRFELIGRRSAGASDLTSCSKYSMVFTNPSRSWTREVDTLKRALPNGMRRQVLTGDAHTRVDVRG
jgi:hypothetical protein